MGINGFQEGPGFLVVQAMHHEGMGKPFGHVREMNVSGYPVPRAVGDRAPENAGCPYAPDIDQAKQDTAKSALDAMRKFTVDMIYGVTEDEIGTVVDRSKEGKAHLSVCPYCKKGFHEYLKSEGLSPQDFGESDWSNIAPLNVWVRGKDAKRPWQHDKHQAMLAFWTRRFNCYASAQLFTPLMKAAQAENQKKRQALANGETDTEAAKQPWMYPAAMRGNTFLMSGHSLDFFNWYRNADDAFVYETSNRDARVWSWDSYLCDVGRVVTDKMHKDLFGILVKPHRGAGMQRALTAISRGARYINWYTYGPEYAKGDTWGGRDEIMLQVGKTNAMIGRAEDALYGAKWMHPAEIAIVKPRASELWMSLGGGDPAWTAAWENAKWVYTALTHAHLPVDPIDQVMIRNDDLSHYKVIYINGPNLERAAAKKLADWVEQGGTLVTMGYGLARDEYNQPLDFMQPVLGLSQRRAPQMWQRTSLYRSTGLHGYDDRTQIAQPASPRAASVGGFGLFSGSFDLTVGREVLYPESNTKVVARYGDGRPAITQHDQGKGHVYVIGFYAGLEYIAPLMNDRFNMQRDFDDTRRLFVTAPATQLVKPVVDASEPTVEGVLLKQPDNGKRSVTLMNWAYGVTAERIIKTKKGDQHRMVISALPAENVKITVHGAGKVSKVRSVAMEQDLPVQQDQNGESFTVTLPKLEEGDILLLE